MVEAIPYVMPGAVPIIDIYQNALQSAERIQAKRKIYYYVKPSEIETLMNLYDIDTEDRKKIFKGVLFLQELHNEMRPMRAK